MDACQCEMACDTGHCAGGSSRHSGDLGLILRRVVDPDYADEGGAGTSIIAIDRHRLDEFFEETKMARIRVGDPVEAKLTGCS
jgi:hypothetical protein